MPEEQQALFAADLWSIDSVHDPNKRLQRFHETARPAYKRLVEGLIMYERVIIPIKTFSTSRRWLVSWGSGSVIALFDAGRVRFLRVKGTLGYAGNGGGIAYCEIG